jgi:hypothetical protein
MRYQLLLVAMLIFFDSAADCQHAVRALTSVKSSPLPGNDCRALRDPRPTAAICLCFGPGSGGCGSAVLYESGHSVLLLKLSHGLGFAAVLLVGFAILAEVFKAGEVTLDIIIGAVCMYLMIGVTWAFLYYFMELLVPGSILAHPIALFGQRVEDERFTELLYVSIGALSSVGFLTNVPAALLLGQLAVVEALGGQLYLAVLIARLVGSQKV